MSLPTRIERTVRTRGYEMTATGSIPPSTLARYLEHVRWEAMADAAFPLRVYWKRGVIRAQKLELFERVQFNQDLVLSAWVARVGRTSLEFGNQIARAPDGALVARASATAVNLGDDRRPRPVDESARQLVVPGDLPAAPALEEEAPPHAWVREIMVCPSDQDILQHVNQARYIDWLEDTRWLAARADGYGAHSRAAQRPARCIHIEYRREVTAGSLIRLLTWPVRGDPLAFGFDMRRAEDDESLGRARVGVGPQ